LSKLIEWLDVNPILAEEDVAFLHAAVASERKKLTEAVQAASAEAQLLGGTFSWSGKTPYLRLIHCLVDNDNIKQAYLSRNDIPTERIHLDNRNSVDKRKKTVWEMLNEMHQMSSPGHMLMLQQNTAVHRPIELPLGWYHLGSEDCWLSCMTSLVLWSSLVALLLEQKQQTQFVAAIFRKEHRKQHSSGDMHDENKGDQDNCRCHAQIDVSEVFSCGPFFGGRIASIVLRRRQDLQL
jgi:hypothetical protein